VGELIGEPPPALARWGSRALIVVGAMGGVYVARKIGFPGGISAGVIAAAALSMVFALVQRRSVAHPSGGPTMSPHA
jgi:hypothetical protein